jgi:hypothetical protein
MNTSRLNTFPATNEKPPGWNRGATDLSQAVRGADHEKGTDAPSSHKAPQTATPEVRPDV